MLRNGEKACYSVYVESRGAVMDKALQVRPDSCSISPAKWICPISAIEHISTGLSYKIRTSMAMHCTSPLPRECWPDSI